MRVEYPLVFTKRRVAGALGTIIAAHLAAAGHEVTLVARGARARWLREHGIRVRGLLDTALPATVVEDPSTLGEMDTLILGVKTYQMDDALAPLRWRDSAGPGSFARCVAAACVHPRTNARWRARAYGRWRSNGTPQQHVRCRPAL